MPRTGRGGKVDGKPGQAYSNRTDLNAATTTVPNQEYGKAAAQKMAMANVPMASAPQGPAPAGPTGQAPTAVAPQIPQAPASPAPGSGLWTDPTTRPNEPLTAGLNGGPGPGPEIMNSPMQQHNMYLTNALTSMANMPDSSPEIKRMASLMTMLGS